MAETERKSRILQASVKLPAGQPLPEVLFPGEALPQGPAAAARLLLAARLLCAPPEGGTLLAELFREGETAELSVTDKGFPWGAALPRDLAEALRKIPGIDAGGEILGRRGQRTFVRWGGTGSIPILPEPKEAEAADGFVLRETEDRQDALEAIRCIYSEYRYSYGGEALYFPERFLEMVRTGELRSFLAVGEKGQTAGHFALLFSEVFRRMPEIAAVVVPRPFRQKGLMGRFMEKSLSLSKALGARAVMGQPVAYHPVSQRVFLKWGFTATALLLEHLPPDMEIEYNTRGTRMDMLVCVKLLETVIKNVVYPPEELRDFLQGIYRRLGGEHELRRERTVGTCTRMHKAVSPARRSVQLVLEEGDALLQGFLEQTVHQLQEQGLELAELFIRMDRPCCAHCYEAARACGFVFSGVIPGAENGDLLLLQWLPEGVAHYERLETVGDFRELKRQLMALNR